MLQCVRKGIVYCVSPSQINMGNRPKRMSCPPRRFVEEFCQLREKKRWRKWNENAKQTGICMMLRLLKWIRLENSENSFRGFSHEYDEWRDYDNERNYFPFVRLEKMFFLAEGPLEDRGNIFHGRLYRCIKRKLWSGRKDDPEVRKELNVEPLKLV